MADGVGEPRDDDAEHRGLPRDPEGERKPRAEFRMELRESLPGDRAVIGVEQEGEFVWLASRKYVHPRAVNDFVEQLTRIVNEGWWVQNWPGAR